MSLAWPSLEGDPGQLEAQEFKSLGLAVLSNALPNHRKSHILDLGAACGANIEYFCQLPCTIYVEDLYHCLQELPPRTEEDRPLSRKDLGALLSHDRQVRFDAILGWDLFDYLEADVIKHLMSHLRERCHQGTLLFTLTSTRSEISQEPGKYSIGENDQIAYEPLSPEVRDNPSYTPLAFEKMMPGFRLLHSFMLKNGLQEYVFSSG